MTDVTTHPPDGAAREPASGSHAETLARLVEAEDTLRAIGAGEVDGFVVSDGAQGQRVFTLSTADRPYRMFVENMQDGAATVSPTGLILYANRRLSELLGRPREAIVGSLLSAFVAGDPEALAAAAELDLIGRDGRLVPVLVGSSPLEVDGDMLGCLTFTDLSSQKAQERQIARLSADRENRMADLQSAQAELTVQATHDALTGLPNRGLLVDRIEQALALTKRSGRCTAVIFIDLDRFKQVNDTQGHAAGDVLLRAVAERLRAALRPMDTVARIGGDEFVVLAPDVDSREHAVDMGARLLATLCAPTGAVGDGDRFAASAGISVAVGGAGSAERLLGEADTAMYKVKSTGGGRAGVFDAALGRQLRQRAAAQRMLQSAMEQNRVGVHYQPIVALAAGTLSGFEALARITREDGTITMPGAFIPVAEDSGLVTELGTGVLERACRQTQSWRSPDASAYPLTVAVNISARQFEQGSLTRTVRDALEWSGLDARRLVLEITETAIFDLRPEILSQLGQLADLGVQIGLDDFGTGYASLVHLRRLPLSFVKIDQSFVQGIGDNKDDERIVAAVIDLAANLGLRSIAEGIETTDQLERLRELGCDEGQGYLFARPLPADEVSLRAPPALARAPRP